MVAGHVYTETPDPDGWLSLTSEIIHNEMWQYAHSLATRLKRVEGSQPLSVTWAIDNLYEASVN